MSTSRGPWISMIAAALVFGVAGCASGGVEAGQRDGPAMAETDRPLVVEFDRKPTSFATQVAFRLNKPAYAAVFEQMPGERVRALYPTRPLEADEQRRLAAGTHVEWIRGANEVRSGLSRQPACSTATYRLVVASERPLDLQGLDRAVAFSSRPASGPAYASHQPHQVFRRLLEELLPEGVGAYDIRGEPVRGCASTD